MVPTGPRCTSVQPSHCQPPHSTEEATEVWGLQPRIHGGFKDQPPTCFFHPRQLSVTSPLQLTPWQQEALPGANSTLWVQNQRQCSYPSDLSNLSQPFPTFHMLPFLRMGMGEDGRWRTPLLGARGLTQEQLWERDHQTSVPLGSPCLLPHAVTTKEEGLEVPLRTKEVKSHPNHSQDETSNKLMHTGTQPTDRPRNTHMPINRLEYSDTYKH